MAGQFGFPPPQGHALGSPQAGVPRSGSSPPVRATLHMRLRPGSGAQFEAAWEKVADAASRAPGNLRQALLRTGADDYIVTSDWVSREAFTAFERSPEQDELTAPLRALRLSAQMDVAEILAYVPGVGSASPGEVTESLAPGGGDQAQ